MDAANASVTDAVTANTSGVVLLQGAKWAADKDFGSSLELASYRFLEIIPRKDRSVMKLSEVPDIELHEKAQ